MEQAVTGSVVGVAPMGMDGLAERLDQMNVAVKPKTALGAMWLLKYQHPPDTKMDTLVGLPDSDPSDTSVRELWVEYDIPPPAGVGTGTWYAVLLNLNSIQFMQVVWTAITGAGATLGTFTNTQGPQNYTTSNAPVDILEWRPIASYCTVQQVAPGLSDAGTVSAAQFGLPRPEVLTSALVAGQPDILNYQLGTGGGFPSSTGTLRSWSRNMTTRSSREGSYQRLRLSSEYASWQPVQGVGLQMQLGTGGGSTLSLSGIGACGPLAPGMSAGWQLFTGLAAGTTLHVVRRMVVEAKTAAAGTWAGLSRRSPAMDTSAIEAAFRYDAEVGYLDDLPASANALGGILGSLLPTLGSAITSALPYVARLMGYNSAGAQRTRRPRSARKRAAGLRAGGGTADPAVLLPGTSPIPLQLTQTGMQVNGRRGQTAKRRGRRRANAATAVPAYVTGYPPMQMQHSARPLQLTYIPR